MREKSRPIKRLLREQANKVKSDCNWTKPHNLFLKVWADVCRRSFEGWRLFQIISALVKAAHFQMKVVGIIAARFGRRLPWLNLSQFSLGASHCCRVSWAATSGAGPNSGGDAGADSLPSVLPGKMRPSCQVAFLPLQSGEREWEILFFFTTDTGIHYYPFNVKINHLLDMHA